MLWAFALFTVFRESFDGALPGLLLTLAVLFSAVAAVNAVRPVIDWRVLSACEVILGAGLMFAGLGVSSGYGHLFSGAVGLGGPWPAVVVASAGAAGGAIVGVGGGRHCGGRVVSAVC